MASYSPKHARRTTRRSAVAIGTAAAAAAMTVATPGVASAATTPTGNPQIDALIASAPTMPAQGAVQIIGTLAPLVTQGTNGLQSIPVIGGLIPITNLSAVVTNSTSGVGTNIFAAGLPGLGGLTNTTFASYNAASSYLMNSTAIASPLGNSTLTGSLLTNTAGGLTSIVPMLGGTYTAPGGLGTANTSIVPVAVTYGPNTFLVGLPVTSLGLAVPGFANAGLGLNLGQIGVQNGKLVFLAPSVNTALGTPLGGGSLLAGGGGGFTLGTDGLHATSPVLNYNVSGPAGSGLSSTGEITAGALNATQAGLNYTAPSGAVAAETPLGTGGVTASGGTGNVNQNGGTFTSPSGSALVSSPATGTGAGIGVTPTTVTGGTGGGSVTGSTITGNVVTPAGGGNTTIHTGSGSATSNGTVNLDGPDVTGTANTPVGNATGNADAGDLNVNPSNGTASATGPSGGVSGGNSITGNHGGSADTGAATVSSSGPDLTDTPSVTVH